MRGWAIAAVCLPGSGDHDIEWKEAGQREHRKVAIDALRDAVLSLQEELGVSPKYTCLYGRSAGGLLVISTATLYNDLVGALYVESPYVDVMRTISNKKLPLTDLETKEFGIGTSPLDILATQSWSPMEHIPAKGIPGLFVIARSDTEDLEVFPYEVVKWIKRVRGNSKDGQKKLLYVDHNKGHFTTTTNSRAEDLALLDNWRNPPDRRSTNNSALRTKNRSTKYKMAARMSRKMSRKSRKTTRKHKKDNKNKSNNVVPAVGGRRSRRKGRKGTRRH
jgi:protease II